MKRVFVKDGYIINVEEMGEKLRQAKETLRRKRISESLKARNKEIRNYNNGLEELKAHGRRAVK